MLSDFVAKLHLPVSSVRLERYRPPGADSDFEMVTNYFWNIELSKALYPSLQALEIGLRNAIHAAASRHYDEPFWFDQTDALLKGQLERIQGAREKLAELKKPREADDIVAALTFGFWVSLFNSPYELPLSPTPPTRLAWHDEHSRPTTLFHDAFPNVPKRFQARKKISRRCNRILWLRNRVMHHEPIWKYQSLPKKHAEILEMLGWISPTMRDAIGLCDDFIAVHAGGKAIIEAKLQDHLGIT